VIEWDAWILYAPGQVFSDLSPEWGRTIVGSRERLRAGLERILQPRGENMPTSIDRNRVKELREQGAALFEVLPRKEYEAEHIVGAINVPLKELDRKGTSELRRDAPVIVYCHDFQ
jgi:hypothetical protein